MRSPERLRRLRKVLAELGPRGLRDLVRIYLLLLRTYLRLAVVPYALNRAWLFPATQEPAPEPTEEQRAYIRYSARLLSLCSRYAPRRGVNGCLRRALALRRWLERRHIAARLVYGAAKGPAGFSAHAWLEAGTEKVEFLDTMREFRLQ